MNMLCIDIINGIHSFIYLYDKYLLNTHYVQVTSLGCGAKQTRLAAFKNSL